MRHEYTYIFTDMEQARLRSLAEARQTNARGRGLKRRGMGNLRTDMAGIAAEEAVARLMRSRGVEILAVPDNLDYANQPDFIVRTVTGTWHVGSRGLLRLVPAGTAIYPDRDGAGRDYVIWSGTSWCEKVVVLGWTPYAWIKRLPSRRWVEHDPVLGDVETDVLVHDVPMAWLQDIDTLFQTSGTEARDTDNSIGGT